MCFPPGVGCWAATVIAVLGLYFCVDVGGIIVVVLWLYRGCIMFVAAVVVL